MWRQSLSGRVRRALFHRRVFQVVGIYLAAGWGVLEFTSWAADRELVSPTLVNVFLVAWLILLVPVAVVVAWRWGDASEGSAPDVRPVPRRSVAVLPFTDLSPSAETHLSDGISEEILSTLARIEGLRVASRTSSFVYRHREADIRAIGRELGVEAVLEGSVQRADDRLRVTVQLIDAGSGYHLWARKYDATMEDVFRIQDEIAGSVARTLRVVLGREGPDRRPMHTGDVRAYEAYLRGREFFYRTRRKSLHFAREMFRRAIELDPGYALAWAAVADTVSVERMYFPGAEADTGLAQEASQKALELAPGLAEAHASRAFHLFMERRFEDAETEFEDALRLEPRLFDAHYFYARMCFQLGRAGEAARHFEDAFLAREDYAAAFFCAQAYEAMGQEKEALERYRRALRVAETHMELNPDDARAATMRAVAFCRVGSRNQGLEWARRAVELDSEDAGVRYNVACLYAVAGETDRALETLREAFGVGFGNRDWLEKDPDLDNLRDDPRFRELMAGV